jgi:hypothetical protein
MIICNICTRIRKTRISHLNICFCVIFFYPLSAIGNGLILKAFKKNFDRFENIYNQEKKWDNRYDFKIFIVINAYKKRPYVFFFIHDLMSITIKLANIKNK